MRRHLDSLDMEILEALGTYGPRNITKLAERIGVPIPTVRDRVKGLKSHFSLLLQVSVYHTSIGLKKAFVFAKATPGCEQRLWNSMRADEYWLYLTKRYDKPESFYGIYGIPVDHTEEFKQFVDRIEELGIAESISLHWSTCIQTLNLTDSWYNHKSERWVFKWDKWIESIPAQGTTLPYMLVESDNYPQKADKIDIIILKELQKNAECELCDIAEMLGVSPQRVQYHFRNHVIAKGLIEGYVVFLPHFEAHSDSYCFRFDFSNETIMTRFALSLKDKPFVRSIGKVFGENALLVHIYLPRSEFRGFTDGLSKLIRNCQLESYDYAIEDTSTKKAQTIPYRFFKDKMWVYDHKKHLEKLQQLASQSTNTRALPELCE